jgi:hypothetical protein
MRHNSAVFVGMALLALCAAARAQTAPATQPVTDAAAGLAAFFHRSLVEAYETVGSRNPKWDADARRVLQLAAERWTQRAPDPDIDWQIMVLGDPVVRAGCDDPAVLYAIMRARTSLDLGVYPAMISRLDRKLPASKYAAFLKCYALCRLTEFPDNLPKPETVPHLLQGFYDNLPAMLESDFPQTETAQLCSDMTGLGVTLDGDRKPMMDKLHAIIVKTLPDSPIPDLFLGLAYWRYSWDAPGLGAPDTPGSARETRHRLAREAYDRALAKDPHLAYASAAIVGTMVDIGLIGPEMDKYFHQAITDDPDCALAYRYKIGSLNTGGLGADANLMAFGRTCLASKRWAARIPFLMLRAHRSIAGGDQGLAQFYQATPGAWQDVQNLYEGYFAYNPKSVTERINYARTALDANHPEIARKQINDLKPLAADPVLKTVIEMQEKDVLDGLKKAGA